MMKIQNLRIEGYRSLASVDIPLQDFTILIGRNNAGKSNILLALKMLLEGTQRDISKDDFFELARGECVDELSISAVLTGVSEYLPLCVEKHKTKIANCVENDVLKIRRQASRSPCNLRKLELWQPQKNEYGLPTGIEAALKQILPEVILIEAFKNPSEEAYAKSSAVLGKIIKQIVEQVSDQVKADVCDAFDQAAKRLNVIEENGNIVDERPDDLKRIESRIRCHIQSVFEGSDVRLKFDLPEVTDLMGAGTVILKDRGPWTPPEGKGQGFQRALYLALLRALAEELRTTTEVDVHRPFILLFEEPEAFLHPALQRELGYVLEVLSSSNQVVIATHSPLLVNPERVGNVLVLRQDFSSDFQVHCTKCLIPDLELLPDPEDKQLSALLRFSSSSEFLFADCVLVVEGPSDRSLFEASWNIVRASTTSERGPIAVAVIEAGNKTVVPVWVNCLRAMDFSAQGIVDLDFLWRGAGKCLGADPEYSQLLAAFWGLADENGLSEIQNGERHIPSTNKAEACKLLTNDLRDQTEVIRDRIRDKSNIWVLGEGEIEVYFGLSQSSKGQYAIVSQKIRNREIEIPSEIEEVLTWALDAS